MAQPQGFRVAVLGSLGDQTDYFSLDYSYEYGLQVFDLCADQICKLVENPSIDIASELGAIPKMKYSVIGGGRVNPDVSRKKIAKAIQKVEIVIVMMSTRPHWNSIISEDFFTYLFKENLAENCRHVVVRITNPPERTKDEDTVLPMSDGTHSIGKVDPEQIMKWSYGFDKKNVTKAKLYVIADKSRKSKKKSKKSQSLEDPLQRKISELRSDLTGEEIKQAVTQPIKETVTAGKSLLGLGQRIGSWFGQGSLVE